MHGFLGSHLMSASFHLYLHPGKISSAKTTEHRRGLGVQKHRSRVSHRPHWCRSPPNPNRHLNASGTKVREFLTLKRLCSGNTRGTQDENVQNRLNDDDAAPDLTNGPVLQEYPRLGTNTMEEERPQIH